MPKKNNLPKFSYSIILLSMVLSLSNAYSAAPGDSAQQALEQLRMLQSRLASAPSNGNDGAGAGAGQNAKLQGSSLPAPIVPPAQEEAAKSDSNANSGVEKILSPAEKDALAAMAFDNISDQMFPLTPEQIVRIKQMYHTAEFAQESPVGTPPKPTATSQFVNLSPGSTPPVIRLSQGFVSSLVFLDSTGAPWPISAYDLGDPAAFNIQWDKTSNTLMIQASKLYTYGNLAVRLQGLNTPVMLTLIPGQKAVDYRVDLRIQGYGPHAKSMPMEEGVPPAANDLLLNVLDGVPPAGSSRLTINGGDARAWLLNEKMYVRTNLTILSPGWIGSMTSADGMHAYEMQKSPVLLVSWHGKVMQLKVEGL